MHHGIPLQTPWHILTPSVSHEGMLTPSTSKLTPPARREAMLTPSVRHDGMLGPSVRHEGMPEPLAVPLGKARGKHRSPSSQRIRDKFINPGTPSTPVAPVPGFRLVSEAGSAQLQRTIDRLGSKLRPNPAAPTHSTPANLSVRRPFTAETKVPPHPASETTNVESQEESSINDRPRGNVFGLAEYNKPGNLTFALRRNDVHSDVQTFERWVWSRIFAPFIVMIALYNLSLVSGLGWKSGGAVSKARPEQAVLRQDINFGGARGFFKSRKLREQPNIRWLDEDWPPLSTYERAREKELEWGKIARLLKRLEEGKGKAG